MEDRVEGGREGGERQRSEETGRKQQRRGEERIVIIIDISITSMVQGGVGGVTLRVGGVTCSISKPSADHNTMVGLGIITHL